MKSTSFSIVFAAALLLAAGMMSSAYAADERARWQSECGACHVAYPPRLLPAESWRAVMSGLDKHFGSDASLDAPAAREIGYFLEKKSGRRNEVVSDKPMLRITDTRWFKREHDEVAERTWKNPKIKSPANCAACHTQAERGNYSERNIRIPR